MLSVYKSIIVNTFTATGKVNLYYVTKFSLNLSLTVHYFYKKTCSFTLVLSISFVFGLSLAAHFPFRAILNLNLTCPAGSVNLDLSTVVKSNREVSH